MSNLLKSKFLLGVLVVVGLAFAGSTVSAAYMHTGLLKMGQTSSQVMSLQQTLNGGGFLVSTTGAGSPGMESMYFGAKTKAAVMAFQAAKGLTVDGVVGAQSGAALAAMTGGEVSYPAGCSSTTGFSTTTGMSCSTGSTTLPAGCTAGAMYSSTTGAKCDGSTTGGSTSNGPLMGGAGSITVTSLSTYSGESVGEADEDAKVLAFEVEADDGSDVDVTSIKVEFEQTVGSNSVDITDYMDSVSIWMGSEMVGEADAVDFSENGDVYTKSITLDGAIIKAGDTEKFYVAVNAVSNLDSGDIDNDALTVDVLNVRYEDAEGVVTTEDTDADALDQSFDFDSFATANNVEMKIALNTDDEEINQAHVIDIDDTTDTEEVEILSFTVEADGDSGLNIQEIPVTITTTGETDESALLSNAQLWYMGDSVASDTIVAGGAVVFEDLDIDVDAGDMAEFKVTVDIQDTTGAADNGDTVQASVTSGNADDMVAEDDSGERIVDADASGSAIGDAHAVYDTGINVSFVSGVSTKTFTADAATEDDQGTYVLTFDVTAFDGDMFIDRPSEVADGNTAGQGVEFSVTSTAGTPVLGSDLLESNTSDAQDTAFGFQVEEGQTRRFTLTVIYAADSTPTDGSHSVKIESINWGTSNAATTNANYYEFDLGDYKTNALFLNGIA